MKEITQGLNIIKNVYEKRGFMIQKWHVDGEFNNQQVANTIFPATLEVYSRNEHVGVIEQSIKEIKERG